MALLILMGHEISDDKAGIEHILEDVTCVHSPPLGQFEIGVLDGLEVGRDLDQHQVARLADVVQGRHGQAGRIDR